MESLDSGSMERLPILPINDRWKMLAIGVSATLLFQALSGLLKSFKIAALVDRINQGDSGAGYELIKLSKSIDPLTAIAGLVGVATVVFVCMWLYRAGQNIHLAGMKYLNYSPGWYVGWFFIPLVQIAMGFIATIELWKASASINNPEEHSNWNTNKLSPLVIIWFVSFLAMLLGGFYLGFSNFDNARRMAFDPDAAVDYFSSMGKATYFTVPLQTVSGICLILFSKKITDAHNHYINS